MAKREQYYVEAKRLYVKGKTLEQISQILPVSIQSLCKWKDWGDDWDKARKAAMTHKTAAETMREILDVKIKKVQADGDMTHQDADEIAKIMATIDRLERGSYSFLGAAVEVMDRYGKYLKGKIKDPTRLKEHSSMIQGFFEEIEHAG